MTTASLVESPGLAPPVRAARAVYTPAFDQTLLWAPILAALAVAGMVLVDARLYAPLLIADLWLLSYHHVVATYTRLAFDRRTFATHRFLAVHLLGIVLAATVALVLTTGAWAIATAFLYLQWFHYMRQGYGISRMYFRSTAAGQVPGARDWYADAVIYLVPVYGIASRSATMGPTFLTLPVVTVPVPMAVVGALGVAASVAMMAWLWRAAQDVRRGTFDALYAGFVASHAVVFLVGYVLIEDPNTGWLAINVWHNFQYVLVTWMVNAKRFAKGPDPEARFLSRISQPRRIVSYFGCCLAISTMVYLAIGYAGVFLLGSAVGVTLTTSWMQSSGAGGAHRSRSRPSEALPPGPCRSPLLPSVASIGPNSRDCAPSPSVSSWRAIACGRSSPKTPTRRWPPGGPWT
jgi:hypothetical protein